MVPDTLSGLTDPCLWETDTLRGLLEDLLTSRTCKPPHFGTRGLLLEIAAPSLPPVP